MSMYEAEAYMRGVQRRERSGWEQARFSAYFALKPWSKNLKMDDITRFPWEDGEQGKNEEEEREETARILARIPEIEKKLRDNERKHRNKASAG